MPETWQREVETMRSAGIQDVAILRLLCLKERIETGETTELTIEHKRRLFLKFLVTSGRLHD